jgi:hypothetical protein
MKREPPDVPEDDEAHPIPHLSKIDVAIWHKNGGYYGIVVERPLHDDTISRTRLLKKLQNYLGDFYSEEFRRLHGAPLPGKLRIYVALHPESDRGIFAFLDDCRPWLADNKVDLVVRIQGPDDPALTLN